MKQEEQTDVAARIAESEKSLNEFDNGQVCILVVLEYTSNTREDRPPQLTSLLGFRITTGGNSNSNHYWI